MERAVRKALVDWFAENPAVRGEEILVSLDLPGSVALHEGLVMLAADLEASLLLQDTALLSEQLVWHRRRLQGIVPTLGLADVLDAVVRLAAAQLGPDGVDLLREHLDEAVFRMTEPAPVVEAPREPGPG